MTSAPLPWEPQDDELLIKYAAELMSSPKIALRITEETGRRRTKNAVIGRCFRKGIQLHGTPVDAGRRSAAVQRLARKKEKAELDRLKAEERAAKAAQSVVKNGARINLGSVVKKEKIPSLPAIELDENKFVLIQKLNSHTCRYPVRNITSSSFLYCGDTPQAGTPYCKSHGDICFQPAKPRK